MNPVVRTLLSRVGGYVGACLLVVFFALPLLWLVLTPFTPNPTYRASLSGVTLDNFRALVDNPQVWPSIRNSLVLAGGSALLVVALAALAAYALSRVRVPGRDQLLYALLLLSSIVTGTAAMVPLFLMLFQLGLIDRQVGVVLVLTGGLLPAAVFMLKDFVDSVPRSYEESARVFGAKPNQVLRHVVLPVIRPGMATVGVWALVQVWGNFLVPYVLLANPSKQPAAVVMYTFYDAGGQPDFALISTFALVYSVPVVLLYLVVNRRYGFAFQGGIKG
ncbi:carbohydrate ABC transporter permease [Phycicoccus sonneratiae]|uniref:Carbohydrate ABC transporter permease n=1 Tax=Phycicoccus sonneratiae TaxID=2807628 RepID=A0ABS2CQR3_9MICO|nr:carbohydrate ABC transporter permease [Phycicoccus sonneraticus]MBM6402214.1 carbohydrate ABC transporter permease [Phycicoccus sonneraticus]